MVNRKRATAVTVCSGALLIAGCTSNQTTTEPEAATAATGTSAASMSPGKDDCPVTLPTEDGVPQGVGETFDGPVFGRGDLWVNAWWAEKPNLEFVRNNDRVKYPSFTTEDGEITDRLGAPSVRVKQLGGDGESTGGAGGYANARNDSGEILNWWPTVIDFSGPGCWEVTQTIAQTSITYVVNI